MDSKDRLSGERPKNTEASTRSKVAAAITILILIGALFWIAQAIVHHNALQNCLDSGRRDCAERLDAR